MSDIDKIEQISKDTEYAATSATGSAVINVYNYNYYYSQDTVDEIAGSKESSEDYIPCPYRGLFHFGPQDSDFFYGRDIFIEKLFQAVQKDKFIPVLGASGSGKSSVVLAGLVPKLKIEGNWKFTHFRPGSDPFHALSEALLPLYTSKLDETDQIIQTRKLANNLSNNIIPLSDVFSKIQKNYSNFQLLLIADQFEEIYTQCPDQDIRHRFLDCLLRSFKSPIYASSYSITLVTTMRADFLGNSLSYRPFADMLQNPDIKLGAMNREELSQVIENPAKELGVVFEPGLVDRILDDVKDEPGNLPLLEFALTELWKKRIGRELTHDAYQAISQVKGALAKYADSKYEKLTSKEQDQTRQIFIQLIRPGEGTEDTRRRAKRLELGEDNWNLITRKGGLADNRLVVTSCNEEQDTVEVVHESLIQNWSELRRWINSDRKFRTWQEQLRVTIIKWKETNNDEGALLRGVPLDEAENWQTERPEEISLEEKEFIELGISLREKEKSDREHRRRNLVLGLSIGLLGALVLSGITGWQWRQAQIGQIEALSTSSKALFSKDQIASLIDGLRALKKMNQTIGVSNDIEAKVRFALLQSVYLIKEKNRLEKHKGRVNSVSFSPNGEMIASVGGDGTLRLWNSKGRERKVIWNHKSRLIDVNFSPDGKTISSVGEDGSIKFWNLEGQEVFNLSRQQNTVISFDFSPNGKMIVSGTSNGSIELKKTNGQKLFSVKGHSGKVNSLNFSPDGKMIVSGGKDGSIKVWNLDGQEVKNIEKNNNEVNSVKFSPDGKIIASAYDKGRVKIWNIDGTLFEALTEKKSDTKVDSSVLDSSSTSISTLCFSPDGKFIAIGNGEGVIKIWKNWQEKTWTSHLNVLGSHKNTVKDISFSPDGKTIASASVDGSIKLWNLNGVEPNILTPGQGDSGPVRGISFSPDGKKIFSGDAMGVMRIWHLPSLRETFLGQQGDDVISSIAYSPDGQRIASSHISGIVKIWDLEGKELLNISESNSRVNSLSFSPDGNKIIFGNDNGVIRAWDFNERSANIIGKHEGGAVHNLSVSPNGKTIVSGSGNGIIKVWNYDGEELKELKGHLGIVNSVNFSLDGKKIISSGDDSTVKIWSSTGQELRTFWGKNDTIKSSNFSPDGKIIASSGGRTELWLINESEPITIKPSTTGPSLSSDDLVFSFDGKRIAVGNGDGTITLWNININHLQSQGCQWLQDYIKNSSKVTDGVHDLCKGVGLSVQMLIDRGRELAISGEVKKAVFEFIKAREIDSNLHINPEVEARKIASKSLSNQAYNLFNNGELEDSFTNLKKSLELDKEIDNSLDYDPEIRAKEMLISFYISNIEESMSKWLAKENRREYEYEHFDENTSNYIELYSRFKKLSLNREMILDLSYHYCISGSIFDFASNVMSMCDKLVELESIPGTFEWMRGIAKAMTDDLEGAQKDFEASINWIDNDKIKSTYTQESLDQLKQLRKSWVNDIKAGNNPFKSLLPQERANIYKTTPQPISE